jgi:serine/threonine-protein kinase
VPVAGELRDHLQASLGNAYVIERELGGGGMSRVFVATEAALGRRVVIKVLPPDTAAQVSIERFKREITVAAQLQQAHIVQLLSAGEAGGLPYYTMPFIDGESLRARLIREREFPISETINVLKEVARALAYAHQHGVVHRDIKPDNVLLSGGSAMVTDFGVAKALSASTNAEGSNLTAFGVALGTPAYMAPEQASADPMVDHRADIYAFGVMAYELLTGQPPFAGRPPHATLAAHVKEEPESVERRREAVPPALAQLVMRCLAKRPADRPQSAGEIVRALENIVTSGTGLSPTAPSAEVIAPHQRIRRWGVLVGTGLAVIAVAAGVIMTLSADRQSATTTPISIAVLPFTNLSGLPEDEPFTDGMTIEVADRLGQLSGFSVKPATVAKAAVRELKDDLRAIGQRLGVGSLLYGEVRHAGSRMRINVRLVNADSGTQRWSDQYDADFKDQFAITDSIARAIAGALRVRLGSGDKAKLARVATRSTEAHALYLQGLHQWNRRTYENIRRAISLFEQAIAKDSNYAQAHAGLAMAYAVLPNYSDVNNDEMLALAEEAAHRALQLDSTSAEAHTALGFARLHKYRNGSAERELRHAIELDSTFATAHQWLGILMARGGRFDEAIAEGRKGLDLDPTSGVMYTSLGASLNAAHRYVAADSLNRQLFDFVPTYANGYRNRTITLLGLNRPKEAVEAAKMYLQLSGSRQSYPLALLGAAYAANGQRAEAEAVLAELLDRSRREPVAAAGIAFLYDALGDRTRGLEWLERAVRQHDPLHNWARQLFFDGLRADPRGAAIFAKTESWSDTARSR